MFRRAVVSFLPFAVAALALAAAPACLPTPDGDDDGDPQDAPDGPMPVIPLDELHVIGFGDSVTTGYCSSSGHSYVELLIENDDDLHPSFAGRDLSSRFGSVTESNKAVDGATSCNFTEQGIRAALQSDSDTGKPTIVVITLGGNDLIHDYSCANPHECAGYCADLVDATEWAGRFKDRVLGFIQAADDEIDGEMFVFLGNIYDPTDGIGDIENASVPLPPWPDALDVLALYNQTIDEIAVTAGATMVDVRGAMLGHGLHYDDASHPQYDADDPSYWYCANLEDPNDQGYAAIREAFWVAIAGRLGLE